MDKILDVFLDKLLKLNPFDRSYKMLCMLGLILVIIPSAYFFYEQKHCSDASIQLEGEKNVLDKKSEQVNRHIKLNNEIISSILKHDFSYEETVKKTTPFFDEDKIYEKEIDAIEIDRINLETNKLLLEDRTQTINKFRWPIFSISMCGLLIFIYGYLNWSYIESDELTLVSTSPKRMFEKSK
jgi:hypothetical protein